MSTNNAKSGAPATYSVVVKSGEKEVVLTAPPAPNFPREGDEPTYLLPKWLYIRDKDGRYLSVRSGPTYGTLTFRGGDADRDCMFQAVPKGSGWYQFQGNNGKYWTRYYSGWLSCDDADSTYFSFRFIHTANSSIYLTDNITPTGYYISSDLSDSGSPLYWDFIKASSRFDVVQASIKNEIYDVTYDISGAQVRQAPPIIVLSTSVRNDSDSTVTQELGFSYVKSEVGTWNNSAGITLGVSATFQAGVPFVASVEWEVSVSAAYTHEWGGSVEVQKTVSESTSVTVPPRKKAQATVIVRNAFLDVGFSYREKVVYTNGETEDLPKQGVYKNVDSYHVDVELTNWEPTD
ncbi:uncharacterized protein FIBRA_08770 [Fibroporia radiculosa]|uniref:Agglutinin domain-containing protein n=1 Tax=Fibroporia radiculosa TaxID=599839 RepID=J4GXD9_9APHY|nr:uncharacterized protein FIBRA_08770 [Fibroporia radiculosa]CCM06500.1 predicted protein [Fibroporia radiculosa]